MTEEIEVTASIDIDGDSKPEVTVRVEPYRIIIEIPEGSKIRMGIKIALWLLGSIARNRKV